MILLGDCLEHMRSMDANSIDAIVTDPPYGLSFMGKKWDYDVPSVEIWAECLRVLKPGGHLLAFAGTRTQHRIACRIEDAGFEIRDMIAWVYGSGFPKSMDVSKAIDKLDATEARRERQLRFTAWMRSTGLTSAQIDTITGTNMGGHYNTLASQPAVATREHFEKLRPHITAEVPAWVEQMVDERTVESENFKRREVVSTETRYNEASGIVSAGRDERQLIERKITAPHTPEARQWAGWGTALKPALEPITVARKPLATCATNVLDEVESQLRERGVRGEILWKPENASGAARSKKAASSDSTRHLGQSATSAKNADESVTPSVEKQSLKSSGLLGTSGLNQTPDGSASFQGCTTSACANPSSQPTAESAPAAESKSATSSPLTTSTAAELNTGSRSTEKCMPNYGATDSLPGTESFAGIATGLTGSMATVRINRDSQGFFLWPRGLPEFVPGSPLTVAENVLAHGTGALNIDGCRVDATGDAQLAEKYASVQNAVRRENNVYGSDSRDRAGAAPHQAGRWPANLIHDGSEEVTGLFPENRPGATSNSRTAKGNAVYGEQNEQVKTIGRCDTGSAARFFYCAKASKRDRDAGNNHPTVKPTDLMRYLCRLVTPPGGVVLDPFMGSGSTGRGAIAEGFQFIGIELDPEYAAIAEARIKVVQLGLSLGGAA